MNQSIIGVIVFFVFLSTIEASSNPSFIDSISIPGAKCIISIPMDSNSLFSSFEHPCSNYYFFKLGNRCPCCRFSSAVIWINFYSTVKCTLFEKQIQLGAFSNNHSHPSDTIPLLCDSLKYYTSSSDYIKLDTDASFKDSLPWNYDCAVDKRLAKVNLYNNSDFPFSDLLHFILKSASDSSEVYLSRTILQLTQVKTPLCKTTNNTKFMSKAYTINGALIQSNRRLPLVYILKDNANANSIVHLNSVCPKSLFLL
ncbi:MAG: hypothetical protein WBM07_06535 [Chitinivibrionales bacterium]